MAYNLTNFKKQLSEAEEWLKREFSGIRTGRAMPAILDNVKVESYGLMVPVNQTGNLSVEDARTIRITPYDSSQIKAIEKAITVANLGISVVVDDKGLRAIFPELTSERRAQIIKLSKDKLEESKKRVRIFRDEVMKDIQNQEKSSQMGKDDAFRAKADAQKIVDEYNKKLDEHYSKKEKEITS